MPQLWQGRSSKAVDSRVNDFNSSIRFDARMIEQDIHGSMVHSAMLGKQGIISQQDVDDIHNGLQSILNDLHSGALEIDPNAEDVHTFVEQTLTARVGEKRIGAPTIIKVVEGKPVSKWQLSDAAIFAAGYPKNKYAAWDDATQQGVAASLRDYLAVG